MWQCLHVWFVGAFVSTTPVVVISLMYRQIHGNRERVSHLPKATQLVRVRAGRQTQNQRFFQGYVLNSPGILPPPFPAGPSPLLFSHPPCTEGQDDPQLLLHSAHTCSLSPVSLPFTLSLPFQDCCRSLNAPPASSQEARASLPGPGG